MATTSEPVTIKKYANRRLYNTGTSCYVTLDDLAVMVRNGEDFVVKDAKTGEDITRNVLTQIIFDAETKGQSLLPTTFLRQLIRFYGDQMQTLVPPFLEHSIANFAREQEKMRAQLEGTFGAQAVQAMEEQARRNMELFERSMRMFMPFGGELPSARRPGEKEGAAAPSSARAQAVDELRQQVAAMQARIDELEVERDEAVREARESAAGGEASGGEASGEEKASGEGGGEKEAVPAEPAAAAPRGRRKRA